MASEKEILKTQQNISLTILKIISLFNIIFLIFSFLIIILGLNFIFKDSIYNRWKTADGIIITSKLDSRKDQDSNITKYAVEIYYEYYVDKIRYIAYNTTSIEMGTTDINFANNIIRQYPKKSKVTVYYNPKSPQESILQTGFNFHSMLLLVLGILLFTISLVLYFFIEKLKRKLNEIIKTDSA
jgi:hypothetical protein